MSAGVNAYGSSSIIGGIPTQTAQKKVISSVEEFGAFLKENNARIENGKNSLTLIVGGVGSLKSGSQIYTRPDPSTEICVYVQSNHFHCGIDFFLPKSIVVKGPISTAEIPATFLTRAEILKAMELKSQ